jgi:acetolactate synthase-1/2/3 large subunit
VSAVVAKAQAGESLNASETLVDALFALGVTHAFGLIGGAIAPFCSAVDESPIALMHFRHEGGAAFAAIELSLATGRPVVVFATTGPGLTNCITGMIAARWEGARVIFVSGATASPQRGRWAFQETSAYTMPSSDLFTAGPLFHFAAMIESPKELELAITRIAAGLARPEGFVAHLGFPMSVQTAPALTYSPPRIETLAPPSCAEIDAIRCARLLAAEPFVIWAGFGARLAADELRELARLSGARVMCSPRAKGVFPEDHPQFLGVTGLGGHERVGVELAASPPTRILVIGSRLGEFTSFWSRDLIPPAGLVHVDVNPDVFGAAYPDVPTLAVQSEARAFLRAVIDAWPEEVTATHASVTPPPTPPHALTPRDQGAIRPSFLMGCIQRCVVEATDAVVLTEAGNSFALGSHHLRFSDPGRYRVSSGYGAMGHATTGVLGSALGPARKAVAIVGDGAMLLANEISTAVQYGIDAVWIVLNDARYNMIDQGMRSIGMTPFGTEIPRADFAAIARAMGGDGVTVGSEGEVEDALRRAIAARGPFVVDVVIDPSELAPSRGRNSSLVKQGVSSTSGATRRAS